MRIYFAGGENEDFLSIIVNNKGKNKKIDIKELVKEYIEQTFGLKIDNSDEADSFVLAMVGLLK